MAGPAAGHWLLNLDRRWVYLAMMIAVAVPLLLRQQQLEPATELTLNVFRQIEDLPSGSRVAIICDYDGASEAELGPMATAITRHCCLRKHKMVFLSLWPTGGPVIDRHIKEIVIGEFASAKFVDGEDFVNLGYGLGEILAIKALMKDLSSVYAKDTRGRPLSQLPILRNVSGMGDLDLMVDISAGMPGGKEWVQVGLTQAPVPFVVGCTGVQAPQLYPYYTPPRRRASANPPPTANVPEQQQGAAVPPEAANNIPPKESHERTTGQVLGFLAALKGAAEYESELIRRYPEQYPDLKSARHNAIRRMGPQLWAHLLVIGLIGLGNVLQVVGRRRRLATSGVSNSASTS